MLLNGLCEIYILIEIPSTESPYEAGNKRAIFFLERWRGFNFFHLCHCHP